MISGVVFDIREFTVHDGPGIRTTVFLKGCPLACSWCHNPEGQSREPQLIRSQAGERVAGKEYTAEGLASLLNKQVGILRANEGGITFSGGEPLSQSEFVAEVMDLLEDVHILLDTSGYGDEKDFLRLVPRSDLVYFDLKLMDDTAHRRYTGCGNDLILKNLHAMSESGSQFVIRVPLVPGVTDTDHNLEEIARVTSGLQGLIEVNLLPYNKVAGAKYRAAGMEYNPDFDETRELNINTKPFEDLDVKVRVL